MVFSRTPPDNVYTSSVLTLNCTVKIHDAVDIEIEVDSNLSGPRGFLLTDSRTAISDVIASRLNYQKTAVLSSLRSLDSGLYYCNVTVRPYVPSEYIIASIRKIVDANITVGRYDNCKISYS